MSETIIANEITGNTTLSGKYLTFALGREEFGVQILKVREIIGLMEISALPKTESHIRGVINLRGQVICVMDLRARFKLPAAEPTEQTCIIVTETLHDGRMIKAGMIVDHVCEVLDIASENIDDPMNMGNATESSFVMGIGKVGQNIKILLDIDRVVESDAESMRQAQATRP